MALYTSYYANQLALVGDEQGPGPESVAMTRPSVMRRTVDLNGPLLDFREASRLIDAQTHQQTPQLRGTSMASLHMLPPMAYLHRPASNAAIKFACVAPSKTRSAVNASAWFSDGRRCLTATQAGEFCMWGGQTFQFETIIQAHETPVRDMVFTRNGNFLVSGDDAGNVRYWKPNLELVKSTQAHQESVRQISFAKTDLKFATASDDGTVRVWDFARVVNEHVLSGHGGDVKSVDWHPRSSLLVSGSKDSIVKLWDARAGASVGTLHGHKATITGTKFNPINGNWILTSSRDQTCKLYDVRMQAEIASFVGHGSDITQIAWHPLQEEVFVSGGYDGSMCFWLSGSKKYLEKVPGAHDGSVFTFAWNPAGHLLVSGGGDASIKFWCRGRPGDPFLEQQRTAQLELMDPNEIPLGVAADVRHQPRDPRGGGPRGAPAAIPGIVAPPVDPRTSKTVASKTQTVVRAQARTDARIQHGKASAVAVGRGRNTGVRGGVKKVAKKKTNVVAARRKK
jgi:polyadenylation factor subunit 2